MTYQRQTSEHFRTQKRCAEASPGAEAQASGNSLYAIIVGSFRVVTQQTWHIGWRSRATLENRTENIRCHRKIAEAIRLQDAEMAEAAMTEHFDSAVTVLLKAGIN